ncbi:MAG: hypothetical protein R3Y24_15805 [Eubacteriales bacterium]
MMRENVTSREACYYTNAFMFQVVIFNKNTAFEEKLAIEDEKVKDGIYSKSWSLQQNYMTGLRS